MSSYLVKRADHYHYRRAIPAAWRGVLGQREWKQSLKCSTRAEALPKARALAVEHDKLIAELEAKLIKNTASIRNVPIHSAIIDFEDYARCGDALVFKSFECITDRKAEALSLSVVRVFGTSEALS